MTIDQSTAFTPGSAQGNRVDLLNNNGHSWMPDDMQTTLAASNTPDDQLLTIADSIKSAVSQTWNGFSEALDDPVLHKQPSGSLALARYLTASIGPLPVAEPDLKQIQSKLQGQGFGKDLNVNGAWDSDWNTAYNQWLTNLKSRQVAGDKPGSVSTGKAAGHWYDIFNPAHDVNAISGYVEAIPGQLRNLVADTAANLVDLPNILTHLYSGYQQSGVAAHVGAGVETGLGNKTSAGEFSQESDLGRLVSDTQTVLTLFPLIRTGSAAALAARGAWTAGVDTAAATRGPGVIAQSVFGGRTAAQEAAGAARRGLLNTRVLQNIPLLRQVGPAVGNLADSDGLYYKARTLLAAPYRYGQVRAIGQAGQTALMTGAALRGGAQAEQALGFTDPTNRSILRSDALNTVDLNIQRITHTPYAHPLTNAVDALGYVLHGPLGSTHVSQAVGDAVQNVTDHTSRLLGTVDVRGAWERAVTKASGKSTSIDDLQTAFGSPENLDRFMNLKLADLAAGHYAQHQAQVEGLTFGGDAGEAYRQRTGQLADEVWNNPDLHVHAIKELLADPVELENRIAADAVHNANNPKAYAADAINWMTAGSHLTSTIRNGDARYLFGSDGKTLIANAQDAFDAGYGQDTPVRTLAVTRRDYVNQVTTLQSSLQRQVTVVRAKAGQDVADAEQALQANPGDKSLQGTLSQAKQRQAQLETHLTNGDMRKFTETAKQVGPSVKSRFVWDRFIQDAHKLQHLTSQGTPEPLTLSHLADVGVNPDELYTNINGEPRPFTENIGSGDWMREHLQTPNGSLGLARLDTKSAQQATADVGRFRSRLDAGDENVMADMKNYGFHEFGLTEKTLGAFSPDKLADILDQYAHNLASEVFVAHDAPQSLKDTMQAMKDLGYRPMLGSHIGHTWDGSLPPMPELGAAISMRRKVAGVLGVTPDQISPRAAGMDARIRVLREVGKVQDQGGVFPARHTAESVLSVLTDRNLLTPDMKLPEQLAFRLTGKLHQRGVEQLARQRGITDMNKARTEYEGEIARGLQVRDIPRKEFTKALTDPGTFEGGATWQGVDQRTANLIHRAVLRGYQDRPGYIIGASHLEDWMRGGFTIGDKAAVKFANSELVQRAANLPNQLVIARNRMRFTLSPFFDWRRVSKQNYKMSLDGVNPVLNPLKHMVDNNTFDKAHAYVTHLLGEPQVTGFDDADRYLHQQSVWGMYNSRHFEAYYAWEKKLAGESDSEIKAGIHRVFDYGSAAKGGARSPLERTVNTIFFPFSFEKTLLRNTGAYMLNHPQQALLLTGAMTAYNEANQNDQVHQWVQDHLPVLRDLQKLNAFAHGLSPGELGGINAPLLNLFMPQTWGKQLTVANLKRNLPIFNDFGQLYHDVREQAVIGYSAGANALDYARTMGAPRGVFDPYRPTITPEAQQRKASVLRNQFITALTPVLQRNAQTSSDADKIVFPDSPLWPQQVRGAVVNRTSIGALVQQWYPAYNPGEAAQYAQKQQRALDTQIQKITDPTKRAEYKAFQNVADMIQGHLNRGDYDTPQAAQLMTTLRSIAVGLSEQDPAFFKMFTDHYKYAFGPLTEVKS